MLIQEMLIKLKENIIQNNIKMKKRTLKSTNKKKKTHLSLQNVLIDYIFEKL